MKLHRTNNRQNLSHIFLAALIVMLTLAPSLAAVELPKELPLWEKPPSDYPNQDNIEEQTRSYKARLGAPSGSNRVFSSVSSPTYSIHRPEKPNGVGLVICPGGGFRDIWIDREGHDLAIWLKSHNITSLVLKYRTRPADLKAANAWQNYQHAVRSDGRQAVRILRKQAKELGLQGDKIGICGFSAGGHLAISCSLHPEPKHPKTKVGGMPNFAGLFYPGIPDDVGEIMARRTVPESESPAVCPMFIINARVDKLTPAEKCVDFYSMLLKAGVKAELHIFSKGSHGFGMGDGGGEAMAIWPKSFIAWLKDSDIIPK